MRWQRLGAPALVVLLALVEPSCRRNAPAPAPVFTVRLLTSLPISGRWEREAERGIGRIGAELDGDVGRIRVGDETSARRVIGEQSRDGTDLVFCVGAGFEKVLYADAGAYPDTVFVLLPGRAHAANLGSISFLAEEAGYVAGTAAEALAPASVGGVLRGSGGPWLEQLERGYSAGFRSLKPDDELEAAQGVEGVARLAPLGVRVALYSTDGADPAVLVAARNSGLQLVVTDPQLMASEPDLIVAAVDIDVAEAMLRVAREVRDGNFTGRIFVFDLGSGVLDVRLSDHLDPASFAAAQEALERARSEITAGFVEIEGMGL